MLRAAFVFILHLLIMKPVLADSHLDRQAVTGKVLKGAVLVSTKLRHGFVEDKKARGSWYGSGFVIDKQRGWIATNAHVAGAGVVENHVEFYNVQGRVKASRVYLDSKYDFAILEVSPSEIPESAGELKLDCDQSPKPGQEVIAVGHPRNHEFSSTFGVISGTKNFNAHGNMWITDLVVESGSSGSPVVDVDTLKVLGLSTANYRGSDLGLVTRSHDVCSIIDILKQGGDPSRPEISFDMAIENSHPSNIVALVHDQSIGLMQGDKILEIDGRLWTPDSNQELFDTLRRSQTTVRLRVVRLGEQIDIEIPLVKQRSLHKRDWLYFSGLTLGIATQTDLGRRGRSGYRPIIVQSVDTDEVTQRNFEWGRFTEIITVDGSSFERIEDLVVHLERAQEDHRDVKIQGRTWDLSSEVMMRVFEYQLSVNDLKYSMPQI